MRSRGAVACLLLLFGPRLAALPGAGPFRLSFLADGLLLAAGLPALTASLLLPTHVPSGVTLDPACICPLDAGLLLPYDASWDIASDAITCTLLALPALTAIGQEAGSALALAAIYGETLVIAMGIDGLLEKTVNRARPYLYTGTAPPRLLAACEGMESLPSGHTTAAFAAMGFAAYCTCRLHAGCAWRLPVTLGALCLACTEAAARLLSGTHFLTDMLVGAAIGTAAGILVPLAHESGIGLRVRNGGISLAMAL